MTNQDAYPAQCPYHRFAQQQTPVGDDLSRFALALEKLYEGLLHFEGKATRYDVPQAGSPVARRFIGNLQQHASLHRQDKRFPEGILPVASDKHTELGAMIGDIHAQYRQSAKAIGDLLDETRLKPETQETLKAYVRARNAYRAEVAGTRHLSKSGLPHHHLVPFENKKKALQDYQAAMEALQSSELATASSLPVKTASGSAINEEVGGQKLGMYLFALRESAGAQGDANLVPETARQWLGSVGIQAAIPKAWEGMTQPDFRAEIDCICTRTYRRALDRVRASAPAIQMAHLLLAAKGDTAAQASAGELCARAGIAPYPERLPTDSDAALLLEGFERQSGRMLGVSERLAVIARKLEQQAPLSDPECQTVKEFAQRAVAAEAPQAAPLTLAAKLLDAFMETYRAEERDAATGRSQSQAGARRL